jgi:hypothetical protein
MRRGRHALPLKGPPRWRPAQLGRRRALCRRQGLSAPPPVAARSASSAPAAPRRRRRRYLEPSKALADAAGRPWHQIRTRQYEFDRRQQKAAAVAGVGLEQLLRFYDGMVLQAMGAMSSSRGTVVLAAMQNAVDGDGAVAFLSDASAGMAGAGSAAGMGGMAAMRCARHLKICAHLSRTSSHRYLTTCKRLPLKYEVNK